MDQLSVLYQDLYHCVCDSSVCESGARLRNMRGMEDHPVPKIPHAGYPGIHADVIQCHERP